MSDRGVEVKRELRRQGSSRFRVGKPRKCDLTPLPSFSEVPQRERKALFIEKARQCATVFDFTDPVSDLKSKDIKRVALNELRLYILQEVAIAIHLHALSLVHFK